MANDQTFSLRSPERRQSKLRDSCTACARSKVRCSRQKPTCDRCRRKGWSCEYATSNRTGRSGAHNASTKAKNGSGAEPNNGSRTNSTVSPTPSFSFMDSWTPQTTGQEMSLDLDFNFDTACSNIAFPTISPGQQTPVTPVTSTTTHNISAALETPPLQTFPASQAPLASSDSMDIVESAWLDSGYQSMEPISATDTTETCDTSSHSSAEQTHPHCCLTAALEILSRLFPKAVSVCSMINSTDNRQDSPTRSSIISQNKEIVQAVSAVLECPCSRDAYLLSAIGLVVFKLLAGYSAAARDTCNADMSMLPLYNSGQGIERVRSASTTSSQMTDRPGDGAESPRMAPQLVLSELHRVQRLLKSFESRIEDTKARQPHNPELTLCQLEAQLRCHFRDVSSTTRELLQQQ